MIVNLLALAILIFALGLALNLICKSKEKPMSKAKQVLKPQLTLDRDLLTIEQAASYLQVSVTTIGRYLRTGSLSGSAILPGGKIRIPAESIRALLKVSK